MLKKGMEYIGEIIAVLVVLLIIGAGIWYFQQGNGANAKAKEDVSGTVSAMSSMQFDIYNNQLVSGQDVITAVSKYKNKPQFSIQITPKGQTPFYGENTNYVTGTVSVAYLPASPLADAPGSAQTVTMAAMKTSTDQAHYVNPTAPYDAKVYVAKDGEVRLITFVQR